MAVETRVEVTPTALRISQNGASLRGICGSVIQFTLVFLGTSPKCATWTECPFVQFTVSGTSVFSQLPVT